MDRQSLKQYTHNAKNFLALDNSNYKQWVFRYTFLELEKDLGVKGDITTNAIFKAQKKITCRVTAEENGIIAGLSEIEYFLIKSDPNFRSHLGGRFEIVFHFKDGDEVKEGDTICEITANLQDLMAVERVILNLIGRMSGVASFTKKIVEIVGETDVLIVPTRKTLWGLLDKRAVTLGGGGTHRLSLSDAILVKDNHLDLIEKDFELLAERLFLDKPETRFIEVEIDKMEDLIPCLTAFKNRKFGCVIAVMLDNFSPEDIGKALEKVKSEKFYDDFLFEASGGINEKNVLEYAKTGVDIISMGCLTDGVKKLGVRMEG